MGSTTNWKEVYRQHWNLVLNEFQNFNFSSVFFCLLDRVFSNKKRVCYFQLIFFHYTAEQACLFFVQRRLFVKPLFSAKPLSIADIYWSFRLQANNFTHVLDDLWNNVNSTDVFCIVAWLKENKINAVPPTGMDPQLPRGKEFDS